MKSKMLTTTAAVAISSALLLTACSASSEDIAVSDGNQPTVDTAGENSINLDSLDTGDYPTEPRSEPFVTTAENIHLIEAQHLVNYTVLPFEIDPALRYYGDGKGRNAIITQGPEGGVKQLLSNLTIDLPEEVNQVLYGFRAYGRESRRPGTGEMSLEVASLRYENNAAAESAAQALYQYLMHSERDVPRISEKLDTLPNTLAVLGENGFSKTTFLASVTAYRDFLIYTWVEASPENEDWIYTTTAKTVTEQVSWLDRFPASDLNNPSTWPEMDEHDVLKYTLDTMPVQGRFQLAAYNPRGIAQFSDNPKLSFDVLTEVGAEHNAISGGVVYRAKTDEGAERIVSEFQNDYRIREGFTEVSIPEGLEGTDTECLTHPLKPETVCFTRIGRYVGAVNSSETDATQRISAQYVILQQADQDAP